VSAFHEKIVAAFADIDYEPEDFGLEPQETQLAGFTVGDAVICTEDYEDGMYAAYEDDEGVVLGITAPSLGGGVFGEQPKGARLLVLFEGIDPMPIDPAYVETI
jgi:hypothetical protein